MLSDQQQASSDVSYRDDPAISQSDLKLFYDNKMAYYLHKVLGQRKPEKRTPSMEFGVMVDVWLTEPGRLIQVPKEVLTSDGARRGRLWELYVAIHTQQKFRIIPPAVLGPRGGRSGKQWAAYKDEHDGKLLVTEDEVRTVAAVCVPDIEYRYDEDMEVRLTTVPNGNPVFVTDDDVETLEQIAWFARTYHPKVYRALFVHERTNKLQYKWDCPHTGLERKCEIDTWIPSLKMAIDIKTTGDPFYDAFADSAWKFGYHIQAATYIEALEVYEEEPQSYCIIAIRNEWPYDCEIHEIAAEALDEARDWNKTQMFKLAEMLERDEWLPATAGACAPKLTRPASWAGRRWDRE